MDEEESVKNKRGVKLANYFVWREGKGEKSQEKQRYCC